MSPEEIFSQLTTEEREFIVSTNDVDGAIHEENDTKRHDDGNYPVLDLVCSLQEKKLIVCHDIAEAEGWWTWTDLGNAVRKMSFAPGPTGPASPTFSGPTGANGPSKPLTPITPTSTTPTGQTGPEEKARR